MKVVLFRNSRHGVAATLPGERPEVELSDLLGGETVMTPLNARLLAVTPRDGERLGLPVRYTLHRLGREPADIHGDCVVIAMRPDGSIRDMTMEEAAQAGAYIRQVRE